MMIESPGVYLVPGDTLDGGGAAREIGPGVRNHILGTATGLWWCSWVSGTMLH
jgi:hypothetical protein